MGQIRELVPAQLVIGVIHADAAVRDQALSRLEQSLGPLERAADDLPFIWTDFYNAEMGAGLMRGFAVAERLVPRDSLVSSKVLSNRIERELARPDGSRVVNLDPGLMTPENFVLATTKPAGHRVYLSEGIFAEVTLRYRRGGFEPLDWTYPDYRSDELLQILNQVRRDYLHRLRRETPENTEEVLQ
jgi:hypothetical protein